MRFEFGIGVDGMHDVAVVGMVWVMEGFGGCGEELPARSELRRVGWWDGWMGWDRMGEGLWIHVRVVRRVYV